MKAWQFYGFNDMRLEDVSTPQCKPGHVIASILCVQPSVTEAQLARGIKTLAYERIKKRLATEAPLQLFGHEFCARIVEVGEGVARFKVGDRVAARAKLPCENCPLVSLRTEVPCAEGGRLSDSICRAAFPSLDCCPKLPWSKWTIASRDSEAACLQSLSDSVAAVETADIQVGDTVAIFGQGSMGFECMQVVRNCGAGKIITVDVREEACQKSLELGADHSIHAGQVDPVTAIRDLTEGNGADVVFECAGGSPRQGLSGSKTLSQAIEAVRSGGKMIGVSWFGEPFPLDVDAPSRTQPAIPLSGHQHVGSSGIHGQAGCVRSRTTQTDDHSRPIGN